MLTEQAKENLLIEKTKNGIRLCEEAIEKSEKYERLKENKDWLGHLDDLKQVAEMHSREVQTGLIMLIDAPHTTYVKINKNGEQIAVSSKMDWVDFITRHEIQRQDALTWVDEADRVVELARQARESLPQLKEKLDGLTRGGNNAHD